MILGDPWSSPAQDFPEGFNRHVVRVLGPDRYSLRLDACPEGDGKCVEGSYSYVAERRASPAP